ncbi:hypothetical protein IFVP203_C1150138 [Vibrio parahaemolyticus]
MQVAPFSEIHSQFKLIFYFLPIIDITPRYITQGRCKIVTNFSSTSCQ